MIFLLSPSKSQDFTQDIPEKISGYIAPSRYMEQSQKLVDIYKNFSSAQLQKIYSVSENIANLNQKRFQEWSLTPEKNLSPALIAFTGTVYSGFEYTKYTAEQCEYADKNLKILSGLYGIISPFSLVQPYRLEMGTRLAFTIENTEYKNLYAFWQERLTNDLIAEMKENNQNIIINLASQEYSKVLDQKLLAQNTISIIEIDFKTRKNGKLRIVAIYAKKQRGKMINWCIENKIQNIADIQKYSSDGFVFSETESENGRMCFIG